MGFIEPVVTAVVTAVAMPVDGIADYGFEVELATIVTFEVDLAATVSFEVDN